MELTTTINIIGIIINIFGFCVMSANSPINVHTIDGGGDHESFQKEQNKKNKFLKYGIYIVIFGSVIQLISNFV